MHLTAIDRIPIGAARCGAVALDDTPRGEPDDAPAADEQPHPKSDRYQMCWAQICASIGVNYSTFWYRVHLYGMHPADALRTPPTTPQPVTMALRDLCERVGTNYRTFQRRRHRRWPFREALLGREGAR